MKVRYKSSPDVDCTSVSFNTGAIGEVVVVGDWGADSAYVSDLDVQLSSGEWKDMGQAFRDKDIIPDNYNTWFSEPKELEDKERGFFL
jgi:hypothetical protein